MRGSGRTYLHYVFHAWWALVVGGPGVVMGWIAQIATDVTIPPSIWFAFAIILLAIAQFQAFHRLYSENQTTLERIAHLEQSSEPDIYARLGTTHLESAFSIHNFKQPFGSMESGLAVRAVVAVEPAQVLPELGSSHKTHLTALMAASAIEAWLQSLDRDPQEGCTWSLIEPTGVYVATAARMPHLPLGAGCEVRTSATLNLPSSPLQTGWIAVVIDVVIAQPPFTKCGSFFASLRSFYSFIDALLLSSVDVGQRLLGAVLGRSLECVTGPVVMGWARMGELANFIVFPTADRATGASGRAEFTIAADASSDVEDDSARGVLIKNGLARILSADGFVDFEERLDLELRL